MRPSPLLHPAAILRLLLGLTQQSFANLTGRSRPTVKAVELCKLPLSEKFAEAIAAATGVDPAWLLAGDPCAPPLRLGKEGEYLREHFEEWLAVQRMAKGGTPSRPVTTGDMAASMGKSYAGELTAILRSAMRAGSTKHAVAAYRIEKFIRQMAKDFGAIGGQPARGPHSGVKIIEHVKLSPDALRKSEGKVVDSGRATMQAAKRDSTKGAPFARK